MFIATDYLWKLWTVRTYNILRRYHIHVWSAADAIEIADECLRGMYRNAGRSMAAELYRAAGLGLYQIYQRLDGKMDLDRLRNLLEVFDHNFHDRLD